ncbi:MAG: branched-chain amino acid ABC transporter permease [Clostridia bacterium]|nr:branched-chain amino acid ABC transporter permease [Clostridia bacterium]
MSNFIQVIFSSLEIGSIYALASIGIILIYQTSKMTNFAQGAIGMYSAYMATVFMRGTGISATLATIVGMAFGLVLGFAIDLLIMRRAKNASPVTLQIITLGIVLFLTGLAPLTFGAVPLAFPRFIENKSIEILGASILYNGILNIFIGFIVVALLFFALQRTKWGLAVRVTAANPTAAKVMGVPTKKVTMGTWAIAASLGALSALMLAPNTVVDVGMMEGVQLSALIACVLGGFQTFFGPVLGAYILAIVRNLFGFYISSTWGTALTYSVILIFIIFKPNGLIGKKKIKKV